jgi:methanogenic corrinoid protein MtbC1
MGILEQLLKEAEELPHVTPAAVQAYKHALEGMVDQVNRAMAARPDIQALIGYNPLTMMFDNHLNHARFMANVFRFRAMALLVKTVIWVYRAYHRHGFSYDYFPAELGAWQQAVQAHLDKTDNQAILDMYQWLIVHHGDMVRLAEELTPAEPAADPAYASDRRNFLQALLRGDSQTCLEIGSRLTKTPAGLQTFYLEILQPAMYEVGRLWEEGEISVAQEHLASAMVARLMAVLYPSLELVQEPKGRAVVTAAPNEFHETGARCVADLLALDGWQIDYLGANTPSIDLLHHLLRTKPQVLALSVAMPFNLDVTTDIITAIRQQPELANLKVMVGGLAFSDLPELWQITGADGYAPHAKGAVELARTWVH